MRRSIELINSTQYPIAARLNQYTQIVPSKYNELNEFEEVVSYVDRSEFDERIEKNRCASIIMQISRKYRANREAETRVPSPPIIANMCTMYMP